MKSQESTITQFFKGVISIGFGSASISILGLLSSIVVVRYLPIETYGIFILLQVIARFVMQISDFGLSLAIPKFIAAENDLTLQSQLVNSVIALRVLVLAIVSILAYFGHDVLVSFFGDASFVDYIAVLPFFIFSFGLHKLLLGVLQGLFKFGAMGLVDTIASSLNFILIMLLLVVGNFDIWDIIIARVTSLLLASAIAYGAIALPKRLEMHLSLIKPMIRFSVPLYVNDVLTFIFTRIDTILIATLLGPTEVALYEVSRKIPENAILAYDAFRAVFFPFIARFRAAEENYKVSRLINNSLRWLVFLGMGGVLGALLFGREVFIFIFTERYLASVPTFIVLTLSFCFLLIDYTLGYSLVAIGESDKPMYINIFRIIIIITCNILLIQSMGILGAGLANLAGYALATPLNFYFLKRKDIPIDAMFVWKPLALAVGIASIAIFFNVHTFMGKSLLIVMYVFMSLLFSIVVIQDIRVVIQALQQRKALQES